MQTKYKTSLDTWAKVITGGIAVLFLVIGAESVMNLADADLSNLSAHQTDIGTVILLVVIFGATYLWAPKAYVLTDEHLVVKRPIKSKRFELAKIEWAQPLDRSKSGAVWRSFGVGGLFGYYGKFYSTDLGSMTYYVTDRKKYVLIRMKDGKKIMLSPDDAGFVDDLNARLDKR